MVPFWSLTLLGWLASTGTVEIADSMAKSHHVAGLGRSVAIMGASLFAYGVVWIVKFVIFNHVVFADRGTVTGTETAPSVATPSVATPSVATPSVATPSVATPSVAAPSVAAPSVATPSVAAPSVAAPSAAASSLAAPAPGGTAVVVVPVAARPVEPAWEGPARAGR